MLDYNKSFIVKGFHNVWGNSLVKKKVTGTCFHIGSSFSIILQIRTIPRRGGFGSNNNSRSRSETTVFSFKDMDTGFYAFRIALLAIWDAKLKNYKRTFHYEIQSLICVCIVVVKT
mmetsp:Transcript_10309/g.10390  ORF Transcript_10309/g.10390 Transcript_10309/m.10390 type:complete len:116 (-) Transcript_10309:675-1022(-)